MHRITKKFECDYGHRVHNQSLNEEYSIDSCLVCRHLHGHRMVVSVSLAAWTLTDDMVTDFKHLNWFKKFLDDYVDHKFIVDINDPQFHRITGKMPLEVKRYENGIGYFELDPNDPIGNEITESFVVVDFVPTSERLAEWMYNIVATKMAPLGVMVSSLTFSETPKSEALYYV